MLEFTATREPGVYTLTEPDGSRVHFVAENDGAESDLTLMSDEDTSRVAQGMGAGIARSVGEFREMDRDRRFGREVWKPLLWVVLLALFGELFFQQWISRRRATV